METLVRDRDLIHELRKIGVKAKRWRNHNSDAPPADVNYRGELRIHTAGLPALVATDKGFRQAIIRPQTGRFRAESFLVGMDETSNFVCRLPTYVDSVADAHEALRPLGVMPHTIRQGEWFFVPVDSPLHLTRDNRVWYDQRLGETTHRAAEFVVTVSGKQYARGVISDTRQGRHAPVNLGKETWHEVFHNTEKIIPPEVKQPRQRHFD